MDQTPVQGVRMSDVVSVVVDFSNGVTKIFAQVVGPQLGLNRPMGVTDALDAAGRLPPGLDYQFDAEFTDRGGRVVGTLLSVDGVGETDDAEWGVWVNGRVIGDLRQVTPESITSFGETQLETGDSILVKLVQG